MNKIKNFLQVTPILRIFVLISAIYLFILGLQMMGIGFKIALQGYSQKLLKIIADPFSSFLIGLLVTSLVQSSSLTTSLLVTLCATGILPVRIAIPAIFGANIGTAITNTLVSFAYLTRKEEFRRAFSGSLIHDYFNILGCIVFLPLEIFFHPLEKIALIFRNIFIRLGGIKLTSPIDFLVGPVINYLKGLIPWSKEIFFIVLGVIILFFSLNTIAKTMRVATSQRMERIIKNHIFSNPKKSFLLGLGLTSLIQSSSITTSLLVPLRAAGLLTLKMILPYTIGANIGTTITAILASLALAMPAGVHLAFVHLFFNVFTGIIIWTFKPFENLIIFLAKKSGKIASSSKRGLFFMIGGYLVGLFYLLPIFYLLIKGLLLN